jgi:hypothetical protein
MVEIPTRTNNSPEKPQDHSNSTVTCQEGERCVDNGAQPNLKLSTHSAAILLTTLEQGDAVEASQEHSSATFADCYTPVVSDVEGLRSGAHQDRATVHQAAERLSSRIPVIEVALPSKKYTGFNIAKSPDQRNKPAKVPRVSLKPNKRRPTIKSLEATSEDVRFPLQPRDLNRSTAKVAQLPSIKTIQAQEQIDTTKQTKTVVSLVSLYISFHLIASKCWLLHESFVCLQKRKRDVELSSSDDEVSPSSVSASGCKVRGPLSDSLSILQLPVAKKPKKDATILQDPHSATKAGMSMRNSASDEILNRESATQEFALITQVSFVMRHCIMEE